MSDVFKIASDLKDQEHYEEAVDKFKESAEDFVEKESLKNAADAYVEIAECFEATSSYMKARVAYHRARKYYKKSGYAVKANEMTAKLENITFFTGGFQISKPALIIFIITLALTITVFILFVAQGIDFESEDFPIFLVVMSILVGLNLLSIYIDRMKRNAEEKKEEEIDLQNEEI